MTCAQSAENPLADFVTISKAAEITGKSVWVIRKKIRTGRIKAYEVFGTRYLKLEDLAPKPIPQPQRRAG